MQRRSENKTQTNYRVHRGRFLVFLKQDWNKISIISSFITSESCSKTASLYSDSNEGIVLTFTYNNTASGNVDWESKMHTGCNILTLSEDKDILEGYYFTNRGVNGTHGSIKVKKIKQFY